MTQKIPYYTFDALFNATIDEIKKLNIPKGSKVLDVPAGAGALTQLLNEEMGFQTFASEYDISKWKYPTIQIQQADLGRNLPFESNTFDLTICLEGLKHVTDLSTAVSELQRVTKPGGYVLITIPNDLNMQNKFQFLWDSFVDTDWKGSLDPESEDSKNFFYMSSITQFPYLYYFFKKYKLEFVKSRASRHRGLSTALMYLFYPIIYLRTSKMCKSDLILKKELLSKTWLTGRHCVIICRKV
ncbi:MAG: methyltransferase domain-containing protein [Bacteroidota bacterium]|nr:methyltransferase domain-containing protein [Bacteroidota bacterium]